MLTKQAMKEYFGDTQEVLRNPHRTALMVAVLMGGFTKEELEVITAVAKLIVKNQK